MTNFMTQCLNIVTGGQPDVVLFSYNQ